MKIGHTENEKPPLLFFLLCWKYIRIIIDATIYFQYETFFTFFSLAPPHVHLQEKLCEQKISVI